VSWVRVDDGFTEHPKVIGLSDAAFRLHIHGMCYSARQLTDGLIPSQWLRGTGRKPKAVLELVSAGLWDEIEGGYRIHDYLEYQVSRDQVLYKRNEAAARMQKVRANNGEVRANNATGSREPASTPSPPLPSHPKKTDEVTTAAPRPPSLIMSSLAREQALRFNAFVGSRLQVPNKLHGDFRRELGGVNPEIELGKFYAALDEEIERTGETIAPDIWKWLTARFNAFKADRSFSAELEAHRPKGA
jgi:hypothetical protein